MPPWRVAIVGAGIGAQHLDAYLGLPEQFQLTCVCDLDVDRAQTLARRVTGCAVTESIDHVLHDPAIDIVDICLPSHLHATVAISALNADKHVICEKPLAGTVIEADALIDVARQSKGVLMPVFQYRYGVAAAQMQALKDNYQLGKAQVATLETHWNRGADYYANDWRGTWAGECGGVLITHAIHSHDLLAQWFGKITAVSATVDTRVNPIETEDTAALILHTDSGGIATSSVTLGAATDTTRIRLVYDNITIESARNPYKPCAEPWTFTARDATQQATIDQVVGAATAGYDHALTGYVGQFHALAQHLTQYLAGQQQSTSQVADAQKPTQWVTVADGVASIELITAAYESARTGSTVSLPLARHLPICHDLVPATTLTDAL